LCDLFNYLLDATYRVLMVAIGFKQIAACE
jgi:hypothetical protein